MKTYVGIGMVVAAALLSGCATTSHVSRETLVASLGEPTQSPSSSLAAFSLAAERGFAFSCEVFEGKDGHLLAQGDDGHGNAAQGVATLPAKLEDALSLMRPGTKNVMIVKSGVASVPLLKASFAILAEHGSIVLESQNPEVCAALKDVLPDCDVFLLCDTLSPESVVSTATSSNVDGVDISFEQAIQAGDLVARAKDAGLSVRMHGVEDLSALVRAFAYGAEAVSVRGAQRLFNEYGSLYLPRDVDREDYYERVLDGAAFPLGM